MTGAGHAILDELTKEEGDALLDFVRHLREQRQIPPLPSSVRDDALEEARSQAVAIVENELASITSETEIAETIRVRLRRIAAAIRAMIEAATI